MKLGSFFSRLGIVVCRRILDAYIYIYIHWPRLEMKETNVVTLQDAYHRGLWCAVIAHQSKKKVDSLDSRSAVFWCTEIEADDTIIGQKKPCDSKEIEAIGFFLQLKGGTMES